MVKGTPILKRKIKFHRFRLALLLYETYELKFWVLRFTESKKTGQTIEDLEMDKMCCYPSLSGRVKLNRPSLNPIAYVIGVMGG